MIRERRKKKGYSKKRTGSDPERAVKIKGK